MSTKIEVAFMGGKFSKSIKFFYLSFLTLMLSIFWFYLLLFIIGIAAPSVDVILPNGLIVSNRHEKGYAILSSDGQRILIDEPFAICFTDRYLVAIKNEFDKIYVDARSGTVIYSEAEDAAKLDLYVNGLECNGYIKDTIHVAAVMPGGSPYQTLHCDLLNHDNPNLKNKAWLNRPCDPSPSPFLDDDPSLESEPDWGALHKRANPPPSYF